MYHSKQYIITFDIFISMNLPTHKAGHQKGNNDLTLGEQIAQSPLRAIHPRA